MCGKRVHIVCFPSFLEPLAPLTSKMQEYLQESARTVRAGFLPLGNWQHPQGQKVGGADRATRRAANWSQRTRGATHIVSRHQKKSRPDTCKELSIIHNELPLTAPLILSDLELLLPLRFHLSRCSTLPRAWAWAHHGCAVICFDHFIVCSSASLCVLWFSLSLSPTLFLSPSNWLTLCFPLDPLLT